MRTNADRSCVLAAMKRAGAWFYLGDVPESIHPEDECEFPEQFQRAALDEPMLTKKIQ